MKSVLPIVSLIGLVLVFGPAIVYLADGIGKGAMISIMVAGTIVWFATVPFWMGRNPQ